MKNFETLAASYFQDFESYRIHVGLFNWRTFALVFALVLFLIVSIRYFYSEAWFELVCAEFLLLGTWALVQNYQKKQILTTLNAEWDTEFTSIAQAQSEWLKRSINAPAADYFRVAKEISENLKLRRTHKITFRFEWKEFLYLIFENKFHFYQLM